MFKENININKMNSFICNLMGVSGLKLDFKPEDFRESFVDFRNFYRKELIKHLEIRYSVLIIIMFLSIQLYREKYLSILSFSVILIRNFTVLTFSKNPFEFISIFGYYGNICLTFFAAIIESYQHDLFLTPLFFIEGCFLFLYLLLEIYVRGTI